MRLTKRYFAVLGVLIVFFSLCIGSITNASDKTVDGSLLTMQESSSGKSSNGINRGQYLMIGECSITKAGRGKIYVYSGTTANNTVDYLSTIIYVDRYNEKTGKWGQIDCWQVSKEDSYFVSTSKTISVDRGYYYRVHAEHAAGMNGDALYDEATSYTDGIYID